MTPRGQEPNESTDDAVWRDLVARLEQTPSSNEAPGTEVTHSGTEPGGTDPRTAGPGGPTGHPDHAELSDQDRVRALFEGQPFRQRSGPRDHSPPKEDEETGYEPPEPPALGVGEPLLVLAWLGAIGGPLALLLIAMFWRGLPVMVMLGVVAVFVVSVGFLILRLPKYRDYDDDGAAV